MACEPVPNLLTRCRIHCVTEELKTRLFASQDTSSDRSAVKTYAQTKICRSRAKGKLEFIGKIMETDEAILCESDHSKSVVFPRIWKASDSDIYAGKERREMGDSVPEAKILGDVHFEAAKKSCDFPMTHTHNNHR